MVEHSCHICELVTAAFTYEGMALTLLRPARPGAGRQRPHRRHCWSTTTSTPSTSTTWWPSSPGDDMGFRTGTFLRPDGHAPLLHPLARSHLRRRPRARHAPLPALLRQPGQPSWTTSSTWPASTASTPSRTPSSRWRTSTASTTRASPALGGVDVDILARGSDEDVRRRTRQMIDACGPAGPLRHRLRQLHPQLRTAGATTWRW